ncbi:MAG TPA: hypothetical protein PKE21_06650 [Flavobacteriales bacterium]|nr:hypothetical protein [Flavobacteriales bacterium]HMR27139.1 hypothetical protein [Flavobacteriales bacterium]
MRIERIPDDNDVVPDVICSEKSVGGPEVHASALFRVHHASGSITLRIEWASDHSARDLDESDFLLIPETETVFFRTFYQWGVIDVRRATLVRHEKAMYRPFISRHGSSVIIEDELQAESTDLAGMHVHAVPIDPPWDAVEYDDRIEYVSPVYGKQTLRLVK